MTEEQESYLDHESRKHKVGLVLAGGGAKGAYQIGVWKALQERGIEVDAVSASSIGALNAVLVISGDWTKANQLWLKLSTLRLVRLSPFFLFSLILNFIHATFTSLTSDRTYSEHPTPAVLYRRGTVVTSLVLVFCGLILALVMGRPPAGWMPLLFMLLLFAGPVLPSGIADYLNLSIVSRKPLQRLLDDAVDWSAIAAAPVPIHITIARWAYRFSHPRIAMLAALPENPRAAEVYGSDFVKVVRRTRWLAKDGVEIAPYYPVLNGQAVDEAKSLVLASMAFPAGVFSRVKIGKFRYFDGGSYDNTPIYPLLRYQCEKIFVVHLRPNAREGRFQISHLQHLRLRMDQINRLMERIGEPSYSEDSIYGPFPRIIHVAPKRALGFSLFGTFHFSARRSKRLIEQGYKDTIEVLSSGVSEST